MTTQDQPTPTDPIHLSSIQPYEDPYGDASIHGKPSFYDTSIHGRHGLPSSAFTDNNWPDELTDNNCKLKSIVNDFFNDVVDEATGYIFYSGQYKRSKKFYKSLVQLVIDAGHDYLNDLVCMQFVIFTVEGALEAMNKNTRIVLDDKKDKNTYHMIDFLNGLKVHLRYIFEAANIHFENNSEDYHCYAAAPDKHDDPSLPSHKAFKQAIKDRIAEFLTDSHWGGFVCNIDLIFGYDDYDKDIIPKYDIRLMIKDAIENAPSEAS